MTAVPHSYYNLEGVDPAWNDALRTALSEVHALTGRAAITLTASWDPWLLTWAEPQVFRWGKLVVMVGLIKNVSGVSITPPHTLGTIPVGYRPRSGGSPFGGTIITTQFSGTSETYRVDINTSGTVDVELNGSPAIVNGQYLSLQAMWQVA
jgi:hypothetical protein